MKPATLLLSLALTAFLAACGKDEPAGPAPAGQPQQPAAGGKGHHGPGIELGTATIGGMQVRAARDQGDVVPGAEVPVDVWVTGGKPSAVRFWLGREGALDAVKALAQIEDPAQPDHYHTHVETPDPFPDDARLFVEIEHDGKRDVGSFDLKR